MQTRGKRVFAPYPELVDPGETGYTVHDKNDLGWGPNKLGATDKTNRRMVSPFTKGGAMVARHELGHAKWSPREVPDRKNATFDACVRAVEDARINLALREKGVPVVFPRAFSESFEDDFEAETENISSLLIRATMGMGTNLERRCARVLRSAYEANPNSWSRFVITILGQLKLRLERARHRNGEVASFGQVVRIAYWLSTQLRLHDEDSDANCGSAVRAMGLAIGQAISLPRSEQGGRGSWYGGSGGGGHGINPYYPEKGRFYGHDWGNVSPGEMEIVLPTRTINVVPPSLSKIRKHRNSDEGTEFRYVERFVTDQRVFRRKRKKREGGGSVLVDASGSMSLSDDDINRIVEGAPEATLVAIYSGESSKGQLKVIVANGKRTTDTSKFGGGNIIDVPALEWLSCQPAPRVWMSDTGVTGINDCRTQLIHEACMTICKENRISICGSSKQVSEVLKGTQRFL